MLPCVKYTTPLWRINVRMRNELLLASYVREHEHPYRVHHGDKPRLTGYRRTR